MVLYPEQSCHGVRSNCGACGLSADLVISKGGGNFDSLDEEESITTPLYYMLMCKCIPYENYFNVPVNSPILSRAFSTTERGGKRSLSSP